MYTTALGESGAFLLFGFLAAASPISGCTSSTVTRSELRRKSSAEVDWCATFAFAFGNACDCAAGDFDGCLAIGDFTMEDLGVCLLFLEVFKPLAGMTVGSTGVG